MRKPESKFSLFALEYAQYMYINVFTHLLTDAEVKSRAKMHATLVSVKQYLKKIVQVA